MNKTDALRMIIRKIIEEELNEITTTGDVAGYNIPMAFQGNNPKNKARKRGIATQLGMQLTKRGEQEMNRPADKLEVVSEGTLRYHEYKKDESASPTKKIANAVSNINRMLEQIERTVRMNTRLQQESGIASEALYRRTQQGLLKLESRLLALAGRVRNIRGN
jgi:hypothetical protein